MIFNKMSDNDEFSTWSNDEIELLDNIDKEIKLVSSDSASGSSVQVKREKEELWKIFEKNESLSSIEKNFDSCQKEQSSACPSQKSNKSQLDKLKLHFSSNDLSKILVEKNLQDDCPVPDNASSFTHSNSCNNLLKSDKNKKNDKEKKCFKIENIVQSFLKNSNIMKEYMDGSEEDCLREINKRLEEELKEKNALLSKLQENYEQLLLKYAEAQNKIDQLRLKSVCECSGFKQNLSRTIFQLPSNGDKENHDAWEDAKCQKAVVAPFMKDNFQGKTEARSSKVDRPSSLPLESSVTRDVIKAGTSTDSEGVSSVITSMSGHSKILNILDAQSPNEKLFHYGDRNFILQENSVVNDAFDKVKNWQNSLPPLELIETPETTLYDEPPMHISPSTDYREISKENNFEDEELFPSNRKQNAEPGYNENHVSRVASKDYPRTLKLPGALRKKSSFKHQNEMQTNNDNAQSEDIPSSCIIQHRRKKPPLLRCSSLPAYDYDSPRSSNCRNIYVPPLDLENLTLSDVESSQTECDYGKSNRQTSSSYITSQSGSMEFSSHKYKSYKGRPTEYSDPSYSARSSFNKSTSMTPDRCEVSSSPKNLCRVCGEKFGDREQTSSFTGRSHSYQNFPEVKDHGAKSGERRSKHPFNRSVSFNSETSCHGRFCLVQEGCPYQRHSHDSLEKFDIYANNLKARSQVIMKALAAHVNNT